MKIYSLPLTILVCACWSLNPTNAQTPDLGPRVVFGETGLAIPQPPGFEKAEAFHGFQQEASGSSIILSVIPGPYGQVVRRFDKANMAKQGMTLLSKEDVTVAGQTGILIHVEQAAYGREFLKWIVVFGDAGRTNMAMANFPKTEVELMGEMMKAVVLAVSVEKSGGSAAKMPFTLEPVSGLVSVKNIAAMGKMAAFTKDGTLPLASPQEPLFIVAPSLGDVPIVERESFARKRLRALANTAIESITATAAVAIDGLDGYEIIAAGKDQDSGTALTVYQVMLFPGQGGYILMTGLVGANQSDVFLSKFKAMARRFRNRAE